MQPRVEPAQVSLMEELGNAEDGELNSSAEARKLAFYLFWNVKPYFDRNYIIQGGPGALFVRQQGRTGVHAARR